MILSQFLSRVRPLFSMYETTIDLLYNKHGTIIKLSYIIHNICLNYTFFDMPGQMGRYILFHSFYYLMCRGLAKSEEYL